MEDKEDGMRRKARSTTERDSRPEETGWRCDKVDGGSER
jgi:hypothetical protein